MMRLIATILLLAGEGPFTLESPVIEDDPLKLLEGTWNETSVKYSGEDLVTPPATSNIMTFKGKIFIESGPAGKLLLTGELRRAVAGKKHIEVDLPHKIIVQGQVRTIFVEAIVRTVEMDGLQIAYFDPELVPPGKRPSVFESTTTNGVVLITLKRKP